MVRLPAINEPFSGLQKRAEVQQIRGGNDFRFIKVHQALFCHASTSLQSSLPCWPPFANPNEAGAEMPTSSGSSSAAGVGIIFTQPDYLAWQKKKYISPKYKSITAQNDQFSPNNGKAILFYFFLSLMPHLHNIPKPPNMAPGSFFSIMQNPSDTQKPPKVSVLCSQRYFKFSPHTLPRGFAFPKSQPGLQWKDKDIFRNSWTLNDREGGGLEEPRVCS